jgi:type I restriction enzyme M protein
MARPTLNEDRKTFLAALRKQADTVGNGALRIELGWREERYWNVHHSLVEDGRIVRGRGRGGSVRRAGK